jgi:hypothetical protein
LAPLTKTSDGAGYRLPKWLGVYHVVDFPIDHGAITPKQASKRLAILLRLGIFAFVGVVIITLFTAGGRFTLPTIECNEVVVSTLIPLGIPASITQPRYQIVIRDIHIPLPFALTKMVMKGNRCGQA